MVVVVVGSTSRDNCSPVNLLIWMSQAISPKTHFHSVCSCLPLLLVSAPGKGKRLITLFAVQVQCLAIVLANTKHSGHMYESWEWTQW